MMPVRYLLLAAALPLLLAAPLGYLLAPAPVESDLANAVIWTLPKSSMSTSAAQAVPDGLSRFWPVKLPTRAERLAMEKAAQAAALREKGEGAQTDWRLVAIIHQGGKRSALVLGSENKLATLSVGMQLDATRRVIGLESDRLRWQNEAGEQGNLILYPRPAPTKSESRDDAK